MSPYCSYLDQSDLVVSVSASLAVARGFRTRLGHIKDHDKMVQTASVLGRRLALQPDSVKSHVVCGTVYVGVHYKDPLGSIVRV